MTGVLCLYAGLNAYIVRSPVALGTQRNHTSPSVYAGHSTVIITDDNEKILCLAESSTLSHMMRRPYLWQTTVAPLTSLTLQDLLDGTLFVGCNYSTYTIIMMGDPIVLKETDYFTHSQYEGIDKTVRKSVVEKLYKHYQTRINQIMENSQYFIVKQWLELEENEARHLSEPYLDPGTFKQRLLAYKRNGYWVAEWLMLRVLLLNSDEFMNVLAIHFPIKQIHVQRW